MKIDIISGFLGAGKTTLIQRLLKGRIASEKVVLIENEFGEISVDTDFLKDTKVEIQELSQGCICCSLVGDFSKALKEIVDRFHPDRIIIEPSGVGKLSDVTKAVVSSGFARELNSLVCLIDVTKAKMYAKNFGEFFLDQIQSAHTIVLSRTDLASSSKISEAVDVVRQNNPKANLVTTPIQTLSDEELLKAYEGIEDDFLNDLLHDIHHEEECCCGHPHEHHPHPHEHHHDEECCCPHPHEHHHEEECCCGHPHEHHHEEECCCPHPHEHHHEEECCCGHPHEHHHEEECCCGHPHEHHHEEECCCAHPHEHHHEEECRCAHPHEHHPHPHEHHPHHHADEVFHSIGIETARKYDMEALRKVLEEMAFGQYGTVLRAKGIIQGADEKWYQFNLTPEEVHIVPGTSIPMGKICVIGSSLDEIKIKELF